MRKYLMSLNEKIEETEMMKWQKKVTAEDLDYILNTNIDSLFEELDGFMHRGGLEVDESRYAIFLEIIIEELTMNNSPMINGLYNLKKQAKKEGKEDDFMISISSDVMKIEGLFYETFLEYTPIKYFNDEIALRTSFNDFLDSLAKNDEILDYTVENISFKIEPLKK